jgi:hypothetical protein
VLQVSPTLDKTGVFCRQVLDCAAVADALMDTQAGRPTDSTAGSAAAGCCSSPTAHSAPRLHRQDPTQAASFNYTAHRQQQLAGNSSSNSSSASSQSGRFQPAPAGSNSVFPATFQELPALSGLCMGYLHGTSTRLLSVLRSLSPACLKGPLPAPGNPSMVRDVLPTVMQAEVAISFEGLWVEGFIRQDNHCECLLWGVSSAGSSRGRGCCVQGHRVTVTEQGCYVCVRQRSCKNLSCIS